MTKYHIHLVRVDQQTSQIDAHYNDLGWFQNPVKAQNRVAMLHNAFGMMSINTPYGLFIQREHEGKCTLWRSDTNTFNSLEQASYMIGLYKETIGELPRSNEYEAIQRELKQLKDRYTTTIAGQVVTRFGNFYELGSINGSNAYDLKLAADTLFLNRNQPPRLYFRVRLNDEWFNASFDQQQLMSVFRHFMVPEPNSRTLPDFIKRFHIDHEYDYTARFGDEETRHRSTSNAPQAALDELMDAIDPRR